ncbi:MAG: SPOR domain-containing protein, partial [Calditrichia bacterium]|nr:SPOR domain-containing protein [Calditrichia bacterium]
DKKEISLETPEEPAKAPEEITTMTPSNDMGENIVEKLSESKDKTNNDILSKDRTHFTLQFFSMKNKANATRGAEILRKHDLPDQVIQFSYTNKSGQWHKIIYGDYASIQDAKDVLKTIPEDSQIPKPWIRKISTIQDNIRMSN